MEATSTMENYMMSKKEIKRYHLNELREYVRKIRRITELERRELYKWVADGNSVYSNPNYIYGEDGGIMDFISAFRVETDMSNNPQDYFNEFEPEPSDPEEPF
jgi:hypothetical protein